jgi:hypothetical protein
MMQRRRFLQLLGLAGAAAVVGPGLVLDPERALWVPGAKRIFDLGAADAPFIDVSAFTGRRNSFVTMDVFTREALRVLQESLDFAQRINREYDEAFASAVVGRTIRPQLPARYAR